MKWRALDTEQVLCNEGAASTSAIRLGVYFTPEKTRGAALGSVPKPQPRTEAERCRGGSLGCKMRPYGVGPETGAKGYYGFPI
jgi:hypothetical protein